MDCSREGSALRSEVTRVLRDQAIQREALCELHFEVDPAEFRFLVRWSISGSYFIHPTYVVVITRSTRVDIRLRSVVTGS